MKTLLQVSLKLSALEVGLDHFGLAVPKGDRVDQHHRSCALHALRGTWCCGRYLERPIPVAQEVSNSGCHMLPSLAKGSE